VASAGELMATACQASGRALIPMPWQFSGPAVGSCGTRACAKGEPSWPGDGW